MTSGQVPLRMARADARSSLPFVITLAAVCLMQLALSIWRTRNTYFILDDFLNFIVYRDMGLTWKYLFRDLFGHVTPLYRLVQALYFDTIGMHFEATRAIILLVALIPTAMLMLTGRRLQVPLPVHAAGALALGCLPQLGQAEYWWSNSLLVVPGFAALFTTLWLLVGRGGDGPNGREAALAGLTFAVGLGFYDKDLFGAALLIAVLVTVRLEGRSLVGAILRALYDFRYVMVVALAWSVALLFLRDSSPAAPQLGVALRFIWLAWDDAALETMFGMGSSGLQFASPWMAPLLSHGLLFVLVAYTVSRGGMRAASVWAGVVLYVVATLMLTARMRAGPFGAELGRLLRYAVEPAAFIISATVISLSKTSLKSSWLPAAFLSATAAATVALVTIPLLGDPAATRAYVVNVRQSLATYGNAPGMVVLDDPVPDYVMAAWMAPLNVPSKFIPLFGYDSFTYGTAASANWKLDAAGVMTQRSSR
jgi:hypothetical protein